MRRVCLYPLFLLMVAMLEPTPIEAQQDTGRIVGTVTDASNAVLPGARVEAKQKETAGPPVASAITDAQGQFTISNLPSGSYTLVQCRSTTNIRGTLRNCLEKINHVVTIP